MSHQYLILVLKFCLKNILSTEVILQADKISKFYKKNILICFTLNSLDLRNVSSCYESTKYILYILYNL